MLLTGGQMVGRPAATSHAFRQLHRAGEQSVVDISLKGTLKVR